MKLHEKMTMKERSGAAKYLVSTKGWRMIEEFLLDKKLDLIKKICLKAGLKGSTMTRLTEDEVDSYRKELVDIDFFLNLPHNYIEDKIDEPDSELTEDHFKDVLSANVL